MPRKTAKRMTPRKARTNAQFNTLRRTNWDCRGFWMLVTETDVTIARQKTGERPQWIGSVPKHVFNRFVDAYNGKKTRKSAPRGVGV